MRYFTRTVPQIDVKSKQNYNDPNSVFNFNISDEYFYQQGVIGTPEYNKVYKFAIPLPEGSVPLPKGVSSLGGTRSNKSRKSRRSKKPRNSKKQRRSRNQRKSRMVRH